MLLTTIITVNNTFTKCKVQLLFLNKKVLSDLAIPCMCHELITQQGPYCFFLLLLKIKTVNNTHMCSHTTLDIIKNKRIWFFKMNHQDTFYKIKQFQCSHIKGK